MKEQNKCGSQILEGFFLSGGAGLRLSEKEGYFKSDRN